MRDKFTDPLTGATYTFDIGHAEEDASGKSRQITESANTANTGLVKQQGDTQPYQIHLKGNILTLDQFQKFWHWFQLCESQTIYYSDYMGWQYEVLITSYMPLRKATVKNPRDFANIPYHYWSYTLDMEVVRMISGPLATEGVTP